MQSIIAHIDMNSYFASCEQQDNHLWRGKPLGVCEHLGGIIIAPSIEAKRWGIKTGMPVWEARKLFPKIILVKTNPDRYRGYTKKFLRIFADYTDQLEKYSIDEAFLDLTKACNIRMPQVVSNTASSPLTTQYVLINPWQEAVRIIQEIKIRIKMEVGDWLTCSAGVSYSKLVAKIASDLQKPNGLVVVKPQDKMGLYQRLKLTDIPGIGQRMEARLNRLGIFTLIDLRDYPLSKLVASFGVHGHHLYSMGQLEGSWKEVFEPQPEMAKSIGHMYTIPIEYRKQNVWQVVLYKLCEMVATRLRASKLEGNTVTVFVYNIQGIRLGGRKKFNYYLRDGREMFKIAKTILANCGTGDIVLAGQSYMVSASISGLINFIPQTSLFPKVKNQANLLEAMDKINHKYTASTIAHLPAFLAKELIRDSIGFGRLRELK
jgi:DNA polymerase IV